MRSILAIRQHHPVCIHCEAWYRLRRRQSKPGHSRPRRAPMTPPRPMVAVSTVAPLCMTATNETMPVLSWLQRARKALGRLTSSTACLRLLAPSVRPRRGCRSREINAVTWLEPAAPDLSPASTRDCRTCRFDRAVTVAPLLQTTRTEPIVRAVTPPQCSDQRAGVPVRTH
jgi:hypothetical protein